MRRLIKVLPRIFPERQYGNGFVSNTDTNKVIVDWIKKKITVPYDETNNQRFCTNCMFFASIDQSSANTAAAVPGVGTGGSMARLLSLIIISTP
jgi:hypothetical protein